MEHANLLRRFEEPLRLHVVGQLRKQSALHGRAVCHLFEEVFQRRRTETRVPNGEVELGEVLELCRQRSHLWRANHGSIRVHSNHLQWKEDGTYGRSEILRFVVALIDAAGLKERIRNDKLDTAAYVIHVRVKAFSRFVPQVYQCAMVDTTLRKQLLRHLHDFLQTAKPERRMVLVEPEFVIHNALEYLLKPKYHYFSIVLGICKQKSSSKCLLVKVISSHAVLENDAGSGNVLAYCARLVCGEFVVVILLQFPDELLKPWSLRDRVDTFQDVIPGQLRNYATSHASTHPLGYRKDAFE